MVGKLGGVGARERSRRAILVLVVVAGLAVTVGSQDAGAATLPSPNFSAAIDGWGTTPAYACDPTAKPGVLAFRDMMIAAYGIGGGITRACDAPFGAKYSLHKRGMAFDWSVNVYNGTQKAYATEVLNWLFATDQYGNAQARLRRLGIVQIIWDRKIWSASTVGDRSKSGNWATWRAYSEAASMPHTDHIHFTFSENGAYKRTTWWTSQVAPVNIHAHDYNRDGQFDIPAVLLNGTGSGMTEVHVLNGAANFTNFAGQHQTALHMTTGNQWKFVSGDFTRDGVVDVAGIAMNGTGSGMTEVHILDGATGYSTFAGHYATALHVTDPSGWDFLAGDFSFDGVMDIAAISLRGASGVTEIHVLNGASGFSNYTGHFGTALHQTDAVSWQFVAGDFNSDWVMDVGAVAMGGASGRTELHVLSGASGFSSFSSHSATALNHTDTRWEFTAGDVNRDGKWDLVSVLGVGISGRTEVHALSGATGFSTFALQVGTALTWSDMNQWDFT